MSKKQDFFYRKLDEMAQTLQEAAAVFSKEVHNKNNIAGFARLMKELESKGDQHTHEMIVALNKTFITPIEREDIMSLTSSIDDVLDGLEACTSLFDMYQIAVFDPNVIMFSEIITKSVTEIGSAVHKLSSRKLLNIREHTIRINYLENQADDLLRLSLKNLFQQVKDPIELIKMKDIYEMLETTTDKCEDVANTLETIIMRNS